MNKFIKYLSIFALFLVFGCAAPYGYNFGDFTDNPGPYQAQDTDSEQNGDQEFQGQLDYMQEQQQGTQQQQNQSSKIQDSMQHEYQQQIQQQTQQESPGW